MNRTIKEARKTLCANCLRCPKQMTTFPYATDDDGNIIYRTKDIKCQLKPITKDGGDCPYFKRCREDKQ